MKYKKDTNGSLVLTLALSLSLLSGTPVVANKLPEDVKIQVSQVLKKQGFYSQVQWCQQNIPSKITCALGPPTTGIPGGMVDIYLNPQLWCIYKGMRPGVAQNWLGGFDQNGRAVLSNRCRR